MTGSTPVRATNTLLAGILEKFDKNIDKMHRPQYQLATLIAPKRGAWLICFYCMHPATGELTRLRKTFDLNRIKEISERRRVANEMIHLVNHALKKGWNYFIDEAGLMPSDHTKTPRAPEMQQTSLSEALRIATEARVIGKEIRTASSYRSFTHIFITWLTKNKLNSIPAQEFTSFQFQQYINWKSAEGHGNRNINDHTNFFKTTFDKIKSLRIIKENPIEAVEFLPERESTRFQPLTADEMKIIVPALISHNPNFYLYTLFIAHEYIRPFHVAKLRAGAINYEKNRITVGSDASKNRKNKIKQLMKPVKAMLIEMDLHKLPADWFLFGKKFKPSPDQHPSLSIRAAELWKKIVIDGLGINKKMYALKHTSVQFFLNENNNPDLLWLQKHLEHHSFTQTEIYVQDKIVKRIDEKNVKTIDY